MRFSFVLCFAGAALAAVKDYAAPGAPVQAAINAAIAAGKPSLTIAPGEYFFNTSLLVDSAIDFELDATGSTFWFTIGNGVNVLNSINTNLTGFDVDYDPPTFAQGVVKAVGDTNITADFFPAFPMPDISVNKHFSASVVKMIFFNATPPFHQLPVQGQQFFVNGSSAGGSTYVIQAKGKVSTAYPGALVAIAPRVGYTFRADNCTNLYTSAVRLLGGGNMGFYEAVGGGNNHYVNVSVTRRNNSADPAVTHLLAMNADGFHSTCCLHGPTLKDSTIGFTGDDFVNVHNKMSVVFDVVNSSQLLLIDGGSGIMMGRVRAGDTMSFYKLNALTPLATAVTVSSVVAVHDPATVAAAKAAYTTITAPPYGAHILPRVWTSSVWRVSFSEPVGSVPRFSLAQPDGIVNTNAVVTGSHLHDGHSRVLLAKAVNMVVTDNLFERALGVYVVSEQAWLEGDLGIRGVVIANNTLVDVPNGITVANYTTNVTVTNNHVGGVAVAGAPVCDVSSRCASDGSEDCSAAIQASIEACSPTGTVLLPAGGVFPVSRPLVITQTGDVTLRVDGVLAVNGDPNVWPPRASVLTAINAGGLAITGHGTVDGNGSAWWAAGAVDGPTLINATQSGGVVVSNLSLVNPPHTAVVAWRGSGVSIVNVSITAPTNVSGVDGVYMTATSGTSVRASNISVGGACVAVAVDNSNIEVAGVHCHGGGRGFTVGPVFVGGVSNVQFANCSATRTEFGVYVQTIPGGGRGVVTNVHVTNFTLNGVGTGFLVDQYCRGKPAFPEFCTNVTGNDTNPETVQVTGFTAANVSGTYTSSPGQFLCADALACAGFSLQNVSLLAATGHAGAGWVCHNVEESNSASVAPTACF